MLWQYEVLVWKFFWLFLLWQNREVSSNMHAAGAGNNFCELAFWLYLINIGNYATCALCDQFVILTVARKSQEKQHAVKVCKDLRLQAQDDQNFMLRNITGD